MAGRWHGESLLFGQMRLDWYNARARPELKSGEHNQVTIFVTYLQLIKLSPANLPTSKLELTMWPYKTELNNVDTCARFCRGSTDFESFA